MKHTLAELKKIRNELALLTLQLEDKFYETHDKEDWYELLDADGDYWYVAKLLDADAERIPRWYDDFF